MKPIRRGVVSGSDIPMITELGEDTAELKQLDDDVISINSRLKLYI